MPQKGERRERERMRRKEFRQSLTAWDLHEVRERERERERKREMEKEENSHNTRHMSKFLNKWLRGSVEALGSLSWESHTVHRVVNR